MSAAKQEFAIDPPEDSFAVSVYPVMKILRADFKSDDWVQMKVAVINGGQSALRVVACSDIRQLKAVRDVLTETMKGGNPTQSAMLAFSGNDDDGMAMYVSPIINPGKTLEHQVPGAMSALEGMVYFIGGKGARGTMVFKKVAKLTNVALAKGKKRERSPSPGEALTSALKGGRKKRGK